MAESKKKTSSRQSKKPKATIKKTPAKAAASKTAQAKSSTAAAPARPAATARKSEPAARTATPVAGKPSGTIQVKLVRSLIGRTPHQRAVVAGLGLRRLNQTVQRKDTREIRGMVAKVPHLVTILG